MKINKFNFLKKNREIFTRAIPLVVTVMRATAHLKNTSLKIRK